MIRFRDARREDVAAIVALLADDELGAARETAPLQAYLDAFDRIAASEMQLVVGEAGDRIVATYQLAIEHGLSLGGMTRAVVEGVRVAADLRSQGLGAALMADAEARARKAEAGVIQLTTNKSRARAHRFYERLGFTASHIGYKRTLAPEE